MEEGEALSDDDLGIGVDSMDSSDEEEEEEEEMTEADKKFIAADDEDEEDDIGYRRKKKKRRVDDVDKEEEDILQDELELIHENVGKKKSKLRRKGDKDSLAHIFDDDVEEDEDIADDLDDFIIRDEGEEENEDLLRERKQRKIDRLEFVRNLGSGYGVDDDSWRDIQEIFGDGNDYAFAMYENEMIVPEVEEDEEIEIDYSHKKPKEFRLKDVCEPSQLSEKMLTENDEIIRRKDIPERFQVKGSGYVPDDAEAAKEASFISRLLARDHPDVSEKEMEKSVKQVLKFLRRDNLEIPFIFAHRKDYFDKILYLYDLWKIVELDEKFTKAEQKKKQLLSLIEKISAFNPAVNSSKVNDMVNRIMSLDDAEDVSNYININFANENSSGRQRRQKKAAWKAVFDDARKHRIPDFAQLYGIDFENYAISVTTQQASHFPDDYSQPPEQAASNFVSSRFPTPESVLEAVIVLISHQLASLPFLRTFIRRVYFTDAVVSVILTDSGAKDIVSTHPFYHFKYLTNKPIHKFNDGQFLQIIQAENDGLLTISIKVEEEVRLLEDMTKFICNDNMSELASLWNEQRKKIALRAAKDILFPHALNWMKKVLSEKASDYISARCQIALEKRINMSPFKPLIEDTYDDESPSVIAISWGEGSKSGATIAVALDENGAMAEFIKLDRLNDRERSNDVDRLISFVKSNQPQVIVCSGLKPNTKSELLKILKDEVIGEGVRSKKIDAHIPVLIIDDDAARIYMNSKRGLAEFPDKDYHPLIRYCVSLGRKVQDPTMEYAGLFNVEEDYKSLRLHPLQNYLSETNLKAAVERAFLNVVALCGVDINSAAAFPHLSHTLQFVSGLGPRKAQTIISKIVQSGGKLENRSDLVTKGLCGSKVFVNSASFIRIRSRHFVSGYRESALDVLDDTRVHPEDYELARKMAIDTLEIDDGALEDEDNPSAHVQELMDGDVEKLNTLLLDDYAVELERRIHQPKRICLEEIKEELMNPYGEKRQAFAEASNDVVFTMLTGETDETLRQGVILSVSVLRARHKLVECLLQSGLVGTISIEQIDLPYDHQDNPRLNLLYPSHTTILAQVLDINKDEMHVQLSARLNNTTPDQMIRRDPFFSKQRELDDNNRRSITQKKQKQKRTRVINHSFFQNVDYKEAERYLSQRLDGECVVRPSTKGNNHISITWRVYEGIYQHLDVLELQKENEWTLGKKLRIDELEFDDIDQIIAEYIEPITKRIKLMVQHPKFQKRSYDDMTDFIVNQSRSLKRSAYGFMIAKDRPCMFFLIFKHPNNNQRTEYVAAKQSGYMFRQKMYSTVDDLLNAFKQEEQAKSSQNSRMRAVPSGSQMRGSAPRPR